MFFSIARFLRTAYMALRAIVGIIAVGRMAHNWARR